MLNIPQFAAFRYPDYTFTWIANMLSGAAMWGVIVSSGWLVLRETNSSTWVGLVTFSSMLPMLVASPIGGLIGDRYDRKKIAVLMFICSSLITICLAVLAATGTLQVWNVTILVFAGGITRALKEPAIQALIPNQVPREHLLNALILNGATKHGARFFGMLIALPIVALNPFDLFGTDGILAIASMLYLLGAVAMAKVSTVSSGVTRSDYSIFRNMLEGLVYIYTHRTIALFIVLVAFHCSLVMSFEVLLPIFSREELGATDVSLFGYLVMGFGAGSLVGMALISGVRNEKRKGQILMLTGIASGFTPILLVLSETSVSAVIMVAAMGASQATFMAITNVYVQTVAPDRLRSRISSLYVMHAGGVMAFSNLGYGFIADIFSAPPVLVMTGIMFMSVMLVSYLGEPVLRRVYTTGRVISA